MKHDHRTRGAFGADWRAVVHARGLKLTDQRQAVLDAFAEAKGHVSLEEIHALARKRSPGIGTATIYRTMKVLEVAGLAARHGFDGVAVRYERAEGRAHHDHLICRRCGLIEEFESDAIEALQVVVAGRLGFTILEHKHEIYGVCRACQSEARGDAAKERT